MAGGLLLLYLGVKLVIPEVERKASRRNRTTGTLLSVRAWARERDVVDLAAEDET